jgi:hypothetical protein
MAVTNDFEFCKIFPVARSQRCCTHSAMFARKKKDDEPAMHSASSHSDSTGIPRVDFDGRIDLYTRSNCSSLATCSAESNVWHCYIPDVSQSRSSCTTPSHKKQALFYDEFADQQ